VFWLRGFPPEAALVVRCGTFPIRLYRHGKLVVSGSCFVHAFQYRDYYVIETRLNRTWMLLPAGTWIIEDLLQGQDQAGSGGGPMSQSRHVLRSQSRITAVSTQLSGNGVPHVPSEPRPRIPAHIACGVSADHPAPPPDYRIPVVTSYTIISWPAFNLVTTGKRELPW
jgi:hypothetical protein